ncbi:serine/threonine protein kinase [Streptomyces roseicoloratus]|uniref:serine/threonine protein kinase n=1 Tax=Streptomyces roseicoloratus TaxID=2508722 RepID=UPI001FE53A8F|nr:serine/threonine protein kinase [Streptomyces roseicoloratus]
MERPYRLVTRLDSTPSAATGPRPPYRRFVARSRDGDRTVLLTAPLPGADPALFRAEAEAAQRLAVPWTLPVTEVGGDGQLGGDGRLGGGNEPGGANEAGGDSGSGAGSGNGAGGERPAGADDPWYISPYVPALPLPVALAVHGAPLPEETVRVIGAALAETLAALHAQGVTHAGVTPAAVLLTADGPRLTCFGAARTTGQVERDAAPERATGGRPRPPGDVHGLGTVLAYAATGHTVPEREELPPALRPTITACLTREPAHRPAASALFTALAPPSPHETVLGSASALLTPGWLPPRVVAALARQSAALLAADFPSADATADATKDRPGHPALHQRG